MKPAQSAQTPASAASIFRYLGGTGCALWLLVMALRPEVGFTAPWPWMGLFWLLQISSGLVVLQSLLYVLSRSKLSQQCPVWMLVVGSGIAGSVLLTPLYWLFGEGMMESMLGFAAVQDADDAIEAPGFGLPALLKEFGDIVGPVTAAWILISWPRLQGLLPPLLVEHQDPPRDEETVGQAVSSDAEGSSRPVWRSALPKELGDDLIAVNSELQYLRVWTTRGSTLILGALQEVEETEGMAGMRIHRSWWVHAKHVRSVRRRADGLVCQMSDGREIPVSRRRKTEVLARFGDGARYDTATPPQPAPPATRQSELPS